MNIQITIEDQKFKVSIGKGYNDWVWLAHYVSRIYSKNIYPQGTYLPTVLYLQNFYKHIQYHPHPRQKIYKYLQTYSINPQQINCVIKVKKANHSYSQFQKRWQRQAYQKQQYMITYNFTYIATAINRKKDFLLKVKTQYNMANQVKHIFNEKSYPSQIQTTLIDKKIGPTQSKFEGQLQVPFGMAVNRLFYYQRQSTHDQYTQTQLTQKKLKKDDFIIRQQPLYVPRQQILSLIQSSMKIQQDINKTLQQKQLQTKKRNASSSLCCYTFEQLWGIITSNYSQQLSLNEYESSTIQRIKLTLQKYLNQIYQIFFYYFILENQQKDKKQQLGIIYQDIMHFLKDYQILNEMINLTNFLQFYNADETKFKRMQDTLDINQHPIKFPQFVVILLRSIQFVQTSTFLMKGQTYDTATTKIFQKIVQTDTDVNEFTQFRRNLRQNPKIISFIRSNSQKLKQIYKWMIKKSTKLSSNSFIVEKQQFKQLLIVSSLAENNTDKIVNQCFKQLKLNDQIFYYDFLIAIEWLAMAIIEDQKEDQIENQDEEALMIVEKMKYLIEKIQID